MPVIVAVLSSTTSRHVAEIAVFLAMVGAFLLAGSGTLPSLRRLGLMIGGLVLAMGLLLLLFAIHYGVNPFNHQPPLR
jgi:hypothetical protein